MLRWYVIPKNPLLNVYVLRPHKLDLPLRWRRPRRIFVNSMSDLFHDNVPDDYIATVWAVMALAPQHTFQVLTKRHARMRALLNDNAFLTRVCEHGEWLARQHKPKRLDDRIFRHGPYPLPNVWLGVSTENQQWADIRIPALLDTPAAVRWISAEPLLGPITFDPEWLAPPMRVCGPLGQSADLADQAALAAIGRAAVRKLAADTGDVPPAFLDWVVVGGESGHRARPMHPDWARSLRDQCTAAGVPFLFKQWGEWIGVLTDEHRGERFWEPQAWVSKATGAVADEDSAAAIGGDWTGVWRVGKKAAGRQLDGQTWDQYPEAVS
nr:DUF5131 family protein [Mycobacterium sp. UM_NZ2]